MPSGQLIWRPGAFLVKQCSGSNLKLADRVVDVDLWRGPIALCRERALLRGTYGTGSRLGWVCTSSEVEWERKGIGKLRINWEVGGPFAPNYLLPLDDWREESVEMYPKVERHPAMSDPKDPANKILPEIIALCYSATHGSTATARSDAVDEIEGLYTRTQTEPPPAGSTWDDQWLYATMLYDWLSRGHETYYLAGVKYMYIHHYFTMPLRTQGGFIQSPSYGPRAGDISLSWLRLADAAEPVGVNGSVIRLTSTWLGGPGGHWDPTLYPSPRT